MNIGGVVVRTFPEKVETVRQALEALDGVEVHGANDDGRMVVTVEQESDGQLAECLLTMQQLPGVLDASVIYHQFEDTTN